MRHLLLPHIALTLLALVHPATVGAETVEGLLIRLRSSDEQIRSEALQIVRKQPADARLAEPVALALEDSSQRVRIEAAKTLAVKADELDTAVCRSVQPPGEYHYLYRGPGSEKWLGWQKSVADRLADAARDADPAVAFEALRAMAKLSEGDGNVFVPRGRCGSEDDWLLWIKVAERFWEAATARPDLALKLLDDKDVRVVVSAYFTIYRSEKSRITPIAKRFLFDRRPECRALAVRTIPWLTGDERSIYPLLGIRP